MVNSPTRQAKAALQRLRAAFANNRLTLFVGSGLSIDSGLPSWRNLVGNLFLNSPLRPGPADWALQYVNTAVAEWFLDHDNTPLEIAARKIRATYRGHNFLLSLRMALYDGTPFDWAYPRRPSRSIRRDLLSRNPTLDAVVTMCEQTRPGRRGLRRIVTYNYDNLLEIMLPLRFAQPLWRPVNTRSRALPIYHVHGYVPANEKVKASDIDAIVLTEDQYNRVTNDPYSWTNLVQLQAMTDSIGLVVGMSLDDRNLRRLLDATSSAAQRPELYALIRRPPAPELGEEDIRKIARMAHRRFVGERDYTFGGKAISQDPKGLATSKRVRSMMARLRRFDARSLSSMLDSLGVQPLWYEDVREIAPFIRKIITKR